MATTSKRAPRRRKALSLTVRKYAKARGRGATMKEAAKTAGMKGSAVDRRVTQAKLEHDPRVLMIIQAEMQRQLSDDKFEDLVAGQVLGKVPTLVVNGTGARVEYQTLQAAAVWARMRGKFRDKLEHSGPEGGAIEGKVTIYMPDNGRKTPPDGSGA